MDYISVLIKPASGMCNMVCDYCFYCDETQKRAIASYGMMSEDTLKNVIRKTILNAEYGITYAFQGGEPSLRGLEFFQQAVEYVKKYNRNGIQVNFAFQTNGYLINEEWCSFFKENHFLIGLSVDGTEDIHDQYRHDRFGNGTYSIVVKAAKLMEQMGVEYNILTVVTKTLVKNIEEVYRSYRKQGWQYQQYIACLEPLDEGHGNSAYALSPEDYGNFLIRLFNLWYKDVLRNRQPYIRAFENYVGLLKGYPAESCDQGGICSIQHVVEADGSVYPCDFYVLDGYKLGNLNENRFDDITKRRKEIGFIEESRKLVDDCKRCRYYHICRGGCRRHRDYSEMSDTYSNYFCKSYQMFFDNCYERLAGLAAHI